MNKKLVSIFIIVLLSFDSVDASIFIARRILIGAFSRSLTPALFHFSGPVKKFMSSSAGTEKDLASEFVQILGREAQNLLQMPIQWRKVIKTMENKTFEDNGFQYGVIADAGADVRINECLFNDISYGFQRITIIHENIHVLQRHEFNMMGLAHLILKQGFSVFNVAKYGDSYELEADVESANFGNCYLCTEEFASTVPYRKKSSERCDRIRADRAFKDDLLPILKRQKEKDCLCVVHKKMLDMGVVTLKEREAIFPEIEKMILSGELKLFESN